MGIELTKLKQTKVKDEVEMLLTDLYFLSTSHWAQNGLPSNYFCCLWVAIIYVKPVLNNFGLSINKYKLLNK